jgi:transcriptional regulator of NAD metabolism
VNSKERRIYIEGLLEKNFKPLKGINLSKELGVTRQVIVKDIALLRAEGKNIIATPDGYIITRKETNRIKKIIALNHKSDDIQGELECIVKFGGVIEDVIIEHPLYGEIRGMLMVKTPYDIQNFVERFKEFKAEPLSSLTGGIHLHTISVEREEDLRNILEELKHKNYLISD